MKVKQFIVMAATGLLLYSCGKSTTSNCETVMGSPSTAEINNVRNYVTSKSISALADSRGFYYEVISSGSGATAPTTASNVTVYYKGMLPDGTVFDSTRAGNPATFPLSNLILGWQYGIPLVKRGGVINLYLPPSLAYGCSSVGAIPSNSMLIFRVELLNY